MIRCKICFGFICYHNHFYSNKSKLYIIFPSTPFFPPSLQHTPVGRQKKWKLSLYIKQKYLNSKHSQQLQINAVCFYIHIILHKYFINKAHSSQKLSATLWLLTHVQLYTAKQFQIKKNYLYVLSPIQTLSQCFIYMLHYIYRKDSSITKRLLSRLLLVSAFKLL